MRKILVNNNTVRGWYNRTMFIYNTKFGIISKLNADFRKLYEIMFVSIV